MVCSYGILIRSYLKILPAMLKLQSGKEIQTETTSHTKHSICNVMLQQCLSYKSIFHEYIVWVASHHLRSEVDLQVALRFTWK